MQKEIDRILHHAYRILRSADARVYYYCAGATLLWRIGLEILNQVVVPNMSPGPGTNDPGALRFGITGLLRWVSSWDAPWYATITQHGYVVMHHFQGYESVAFFPLFPYLVRWLTAVTHVPFQVLGLSINLIATSFIVFLLYKLTQLLATQAHVANADKLSMVAALFALINPSAFFFAAYYADALLVLFVLAAIYSAHRDNYILAATLAGLATGAKSIGIVALPAIILIYFARSDSDIWRTLRRHWRRLITMSILGLNGLLLYMLYLFVRFGDPLVFIKVEKYWSRNISGFFLSDIWNIWYAKILSPYYFRPMSNYMYDLFLMLIPIVVIGFALYLLIRHRLQHAWLSALCILTVLIPMSTGTLLSLNRYVLLLLPAVAYVLAYTYNVSSKARILLSVVGYFSSLGLVVFTLTYLSYRFAG